MGKELLKNLGSNDDYSVYYINRNKPHWNNEVKEIPNLNFVYGDREDCDDFISLIQYINIKLNIS